MKKIKAGKEWYVEKEASTSTRPYRLTFWCLKHFPRWLVNFITYCAALYFFIFDKRCRLESIRYQKNLKAYSPTFSKIKPLRQVVMPRCCRRSASARPVSLLTFHINCFFSSWFMLFFVWWVRLFF